MARKPARSNITIIQGSTWSKSWQWIRAGVAIDIASATDVRMMIRPVVADDDTAAAPLESLSLGGGDIVITDVVQAATPVTTAFAANGVIVASGATFIDALGCPLVKFKRTVKGQPAPGDAVVLAGTTSNDGTYEVLSVDSPTQITVDATFTAEAAAGTVAVSRDGEIVATLTPARTGALKFVDPVLFDVEIDIGTETIRLIEGKAKNSREVTR